MTTLAERSSWRYERAQDPTPPGPPGLDSPRPDTRPFGHSEPMTDPDVPWHPNSLDQFAVGGDEVSDSRLCDAPVAAMDPITLDELNANAGLQTRVDRKYVLPLVDVEQLLSTLKPEARALEIGERRCFGYESVYLDTADLLSYRMAARRRRRRFKIRIRTYLDSSLCWLEVKTRGSRGTTVKNRKPYDPADRTTLAPGREFVDEVLSAEAIPDVHDMDFVPTLITRYQRTTLFLPATMSRSTIDTNLSWDYHGHQLSLPGYAIVETKTGSTASGVDRLLWAQGYRPIRISKYATGIAAIRSDLPAAPWRRTLRHYFSARAVHVAAPA